MDFDLEPSGDFLPGPLTDSVAFIRTSDRTTFRRCRRKFGWSYVHRGNRTSKFTKDPLWMGTGFHYAMEDWHGNRRFPTAVDAFLGYARACKKVRSVSLPDGYDELIELCSGMLEYYQEWGETRDCMETYYVDGVPQVEVRFQVPIPCDSDWLGSVGFDRCVYTGTIDRVVIDEHGRLWLVDYKTAKSIITGHLDTDSQITSYCWAAQQIYQKEVAGFIYQQHKKVVPHEPEFLKSTKMFSVAKNQVTTYTLYSKALRNLFGSLENAPAANITYLNTLVLEENDRADKLIRRDWVPRNQHQIDMEGQKILMELPDMLNPQLVLYPNPTRDCSWDCDFKVACLNMDDGSDWIWELENNTVDRTLQDERWRDFLEYPDLPEPLKPLHRIRRRH